MSWDAELYMRFGDQRTRPAIDLADRIDVAAPRRIIDLGCGPGNSVQVLAERFPTARITGLDSSEKMIAKAREDFPQGEWLLGSIEGWHAEEPYDLVFSNAALQWIPNHEALVRRLFAQVAEGGALAFQIPRHVDSPLRRAILEISRDAEWTERMDDARGALTMESPAYYYDALAETASSLDIWQTEYDHVMDDAQAIVEWIKSTGLRPFLGALESDAEEHRFVAMVSERVRAEYPRRVDGKVIFPFNRLFVVAYA
jgi:trans-aconitate 2-methyltransferase